jgi:hypothetical protein
MIQGWKRFSFSAAILALLPLRDVPLLFLIHITRRSTLPKRTFRQVTFHRPVSAVFGILTVLQDISHHPETAGRLSGVCHQGPS